MGIHSDHFLNCAGVNPYFCGPAGAIRLISRRPMRMDYGNNPMVAGKDVGRAELARRTQPLLKMDLKAILAPQNSG